MLKKTFPYLTLVIMMVIGLVIYYDSITPPDEVLSIRDVEHLCYDIFHPNDTEYQKSKRLEKLSNEWVYFNGVVMGVADWGNIWLFDNEQFVTTLVTIRDAPDDLLWQLFCGSTLSGWGKIDYIHWFGESPQIYINFVLAE